MNLTSIAIQLKTDELKKGIRLLGDLEKSGVRAEKSLAKLGKVSAKAISSNTTSAQLALNKSIKDAESLVNKLTRAVIAKDKSVAKSTLTAMSNAKVVKSSTVSTERSTRAIIAQNRAISNSSANWSGHTQSLNNATISSNKMQFAISGMARTMGNFSTYTLPALGALLVHNMLQGADAITKVENQLKLLSANLDDVAIAMSAVEKISLKTYSSLDANAKLVTALSGAFSGLNRSQSDSYKFIERFQKALSLTNPTIKESESATLQFVQAMGSGVLRGEEFNSIMENGRGVAMMLAKGLDVSIGSLRVMAHAGELTSEVVIRSLEAVGDVIDNKFNAKVMSMSDSYSNLGQVSIIVLGRLNKSLGASVDKLSNWGEEAEKAETATQKLAMAINTFSKGLLATSDNLTTLLGVVSGGLVFLKIAKKVSELTLAKKALTKQGKELNKITKAGKRYLSESGNAANLATLEFAGMGAIMLATTVSAKALLVALKSLSRNPYALGITAIALTIASISSAGEDAEESLRKLESRLDSITGDAGSASLLSDEEIAKVSKLVDLETELRALKSTMFNSFTIDNDRDIVRDKIKALRSEIELIYLKAEISQEIATEELSRINAIKQLDEANADIRIAGMTAYDKLSKEMDEEAFLRGKKGLELELAKFKLTEEYLSVVAQDTLESAKASENHVAYLNKALKLVEMFTENYKAQSLLDSSSEKIKSNNKLVSLQSQLNKLVMTEGSYRLFLLGGMADAEASLQRQIWLKQDSNKQDVFLKKQADSRYAIQEKINLALMTETEYRNHLLESMNSGDSSLIKQLWNEEDRTEMESFLTGISEQIKELGSGWESSGIKGGKLFSDSYNALNKHHKATVKYSKLENKILEKRIKNDAKFNSGLIEKEEHDLTSTSLAKSANDLESAHQSESLSFYSDLAGATSNLFEEGSKGALAFKIIQDSLAVSAGVSAILTQGDGDPYTAPARMAAMAVGVAGLLANIGQSVSALSSGGGGATPISHDPEASQKARGLGSVLGESGETADSISSLGEMLSDVGADQYTELRGINRGIKILNGSFNGITTSFANSGYGDFGTIKGVKLGSTSQSLNFAHSKEYVANGGISFDKVNLGDLRSGEADLNSKAYASITKKRYDSWGRRIGDHHRTAYAALEKTQSSMLQDIVISSADLAIELGDSLGMDVTDAVNAVDIDIANISLKGLSASKQQEALQAAFSKLNDTITTEVFSDLTDKYQKAGEESLETIGRLAMDKAVVEAELAKVGKSVQGDAIEFSEALISMAGGIEDFVELSQQYFNNFFSDAEKFDANKRELNASFDDLNYSLPITRDGFRELVDGIDLSTDSGKEASISLKRMSDDASTYYDYIEDKQSELYSQSDAMRDSLLGFIDAEAQLAFQRELSLKEIDPVLKSYQKQIWALEDFSELSSVFDSINSFIKGLVVSSVLLAGTSFAEDISLAKTGDVTALEGITSSAQNYLNVSKNASSTLAEYSLTKSEVARDLAGLESNVRPEAFIVDGISNSIENQTEMLLANLAITTTAESARLDGSHADGLDYVPFDGYRAELHKGETVLTSEQASVYRNQSNSEVMLSLKQEIRELKEQSRQIGIALINNTKDTSEVLEKFDIIGLPKERT